LLRRNLRKSGRVFRRLVGKARGTSKVCVTAAAIVLDEQHADPGKVVRRVCGPAHLSSGRRRSVVTRICGGGEGSFNDERRAHARTLALDPGRAPGRAAGEGRSAGCTLTDADPRDVPN
jgi:hypothetical protein